MKEEGVVGRGGSSVARRAWHKSCQSPRQVARMRRRLVTFTRVVAVLALGPTLAGAQQPQAAELADLTLEQLLLVPVSATSKRPQSPKDAPAVVSVVTAEEIRHHGYRTLGDILRTLPGFYVTDDRNYSYLGVRGFGLPGDYNTRVLLLVNGTRTNDNVYDEAFVGREFVLDPDLIARVEVSKGPGASVYGNSAFFAVVNVVTKRGRDLDGGRLSASGGSFGTYEASASYGRRLPNGLELLASAAWLDSAGQTLSFPEFATTNGGVVRGADSQAALRTFGSISFKGVGLELAYVDRHKRIPTASYDTLFGDTRAQTRDELLMMTARYAASLGRAFDVDARLSSGVYNYTGDYPYATGPDETDVFADLASGHWWTAEASGTWRAGRHTLLLGGDFQRNTRQDQRYGYVRAPDLELDVRHRSERLALYAQDDVALGPRLRLSLGGRFDHHFGQAEDAAADRVNPRLALIASPDARTTLKLLYGRAFRAPNEYEMHYYASQATPSLVPETIETVELAAERSLGAGARVSGSIYSSSIEQLIALDSNDEGGLFFRNTDRLASAGGELALELRSPRGAAGRISYGLQRTENASGAPVTNSPRHLLNATLSVPVARRRFWASAEVAYLSERRTTAGTRTGSVALAHLNLLATHLPGGLEAAVTVRNVFDRRYSDPASAEHRQSAIEQDGRSFRLALSRRF